MALIAKKRLQKACEFLNQARVDEDSVSVKVNAEFQFQMHKERGQLKDLLKQEGTFGRICEDCHRGYCKLYKEQISSSIASKRQLQLQIDYCLKLLPGLVKNYVDDCRKKSIVAAEMDISATIHAIGQAVFAECQKILQQYFEQSQASTNLIAEDAKLLQDDVVLLLISGGTMGQIIRLRHNPTQT